MRQVYRVEKVSFELGGTAFITENGHVIEGNFRIGDWVLSVFDKKSKRWLPIYRKKRMPDTPMVPGKAVGKSVIVTEPMGCMAQWDDSQNKIFFKTEKVEKHFYIDLSALGETVHDLRALTGLCGINMLIGGFSFTPGSYDPYSHHAIPDEIRVVKYKVGDEISGTAVYGGVTYKRRDVSFSKLTIPARQAEWPVRKYEARSNVADVSLLGGHVTGITSNGDFFANEWDFACPTSMAIWYDPPPNTNEFSFAYVKFQLIAFIMSYNSVLVSYTGIGAGQQPEAKEAYFTRGGDWMYVYHDGVSWKLVPSQYEDENFELVFVGVPHPDGSLPYKYHGWHWNERMSGYVSDFWLILRDKSWYYSGNRHEFAVCCRGCYPIYKDDYSGVAGYLKLWETHIGDHVTGTTYVNDRLWAIFTPLNKAKCVYDRSYVRDDEECDTCFHLCARRGTGGFQYFPGWPGTWIQPVCPADHGFHGGGIKKRCGGFSVAIGQYFTWFYIYNFWEWAGKRGVCIIDGNIYGAGEVIPEEIFKSSVHPYGQTQNQPLLTEETTISGGVEHEGAYPSRRYVPVAMRYRLYWSIKAKAKNSIGEEFTWNGDKERGDYDGVEWPFCDVKTPFFGLVNLAD